MAYAQIDDVKSWIAVSDSGLDSMISDALDAASEWVDNYCARTFTLDASVSARYFNVSSDGMVLTDDIGDATGLLVASDDTHTGTYATAWAADEFQLLPLSRVYRPQPFWQIAPTGVRWFPYHGFPVRQGLVRVTAKWGWPSVPSGVKQACIQQAARIVNRRNSPNGVAGANDFGIVRVSATDPDIEALLNPYRLLVVA